MVVLFIIVLLGYTLCKLSYMGDKFDQKLSAIVIDVTCPALILSSVMGDRMPDRTLILPLLGVGFLTYFVLLIFGFWVPRLISKNHDEQGMIGFALMFANVGFIGYPIVSSIFGPEAVFYAALLNMPNTFFIFTAGVMLVKGEYSIKQLNPKVLFSPAMIAAFLAALLVALGVRTPDVVGRPITMVGAITVPAALMVIGSSMAPDCRQPEGLRVVSRQTAGSAVIDLRPLPFLRCQRHCQQHQHGGHRHASGVVWHNVLHEVWPRAIANDRDHVCHHRGLYCHHTPCHTAIQIGRPTRKAFQPPRQTPSSTVSCHITRNRKQPHHFVGTGRMVSEILFIPLQENRPFT